MILVNVSRSAVGAVTEAQLAESSRAHWKVSEESIRGYGDHLAAVRDNVIVGVWRIVGHSRPDEGGGKVAFDLAPAPERSELVGQEVPTPWVRGAANPVKFWDYRPDTDPSLDNQAVVVAGWHIAPHPYGGLEVRSPEGAGPLHVAALIGEPTGGVAVLQTCPSFHP